MWGGNGSCLDFSVQKGSWCSTQALGTDVHIWRAADAGGFPALIRVDSGGDGRVSLRSSPGAALCQHTAPLGCEGLLGPPQQGAEDRLQALGRNCNCNASPWSLLAVV